MEALAVDCEELFFGGAAGGGKTDWLWQSALQYVDVPGYTAVILRLNEGDWDHPDSLRSRARLWLAGTAARWDGVGTVWFPSGAAIAFMGGYRGNLPALMQAHQGPGVQFLGFDELPQWPEEAYRWLIGSRLRRKVGVPVPLRARSTGNPGGPGHHWVRKRFVDHARHATSQRLVREDLHAHRSGTPLPTPATYESPPSPEAVSLARELGRSAKGAFFVPAFAADNPAIDLPAYREQLVKLSPVDRLRMEWGDWWVEDATRLFTAPAKYSRLPTQYRRAFGVDLAYAAKRSSDASAMVSMVRERGGDPLRPVFFVAHVIVARVRPPEFREMIYPHHRAAPDAAWRWYTSSTESGTADLLNTGEHAVPVTPHLARADKFTRAVNLAAAWNDGRVLVPETAAGWDAEGFVNEHLAFTGLGTEHDDQVDADVAAFDELDGDLSVVGTEPTAPTRLNPYHRWGL